jgi:thioredoxin
MNFSKGNHILKFSATWCGPCKTYAPIFDEAVSDLTDIEIHRLDVDEFQDVAKAYGVRGIPTTLFIKDGKVIADKVGLSTVGDLKEISKKFNSEE